MVAITSEITPLDDPNPLEFHKASSGELLATKVASSSPLAFMGVTATAVLLVFRP